MKVSLSATSLDELRNWPTGVPHLYAAVHQRHDADVVEIRVMSLVLEDADESGIRASQVSQLRFDDDEVRPRWVPITPTETTPPTLTVDGALNAAVNGLADDIGRALAVHVRSGLGALS